MKVIKKHNHKNLDRLTYISGILLPILTIPQAYTVLVLKETDGVSLITWTFYLISSFLFAVFGIVHKERLLIMTYVPFVFIELLIVIGIILN